MVRLSPVLVVLAVAVDNPNTVLNAVKAASVETKARANGLVGLFIFIYSDIVARYIDVSISYFEHSHSLAKFLSVVCRESWSFIDEQAIVIELKGSRNHEQNPENIRNDFF